MSTPDLSPRRVAIAQLVAEGLTDKQIGASLCLHPNTVRWHVGVIARRLRLSTAHDTRVLIARWWWERRNVA